ncbi:MAG: TlpA family protein disulfide reductase, partial [Bacteroidaceae bacterium]|nr:TlpA family protein disulfide reductase [Bacteroidaceae bacterium]
DSLYRLPDVPRDIVQSKFDEIGKLHVQIRDRKVEYIKQHSDNIVSGYLLTRLPNDEAEKLLPNLTDRVKSSEIKPLLDSKIERILRQRQKDNAAERVIEGAVAPDFILENSEGHNFSLSSLRGKPVVLDFWGTWCGYCIKGIPDMKKYYDKYNGKVEFVSIDCRDKKENWIAALKKYDMNWIHVYNDKEGTDDITVRYGIKGFPTKYIVDQNGIIVAVFLGETPAFYQKMDSLFGK